MNRDDIVEGAREAIQQGSKSFRAASRLFDRTTRERAWMLYCWCRHCDDVCDGQVLGFGHGEGGNVGLLREKTRQTVAGSPPDEVPFLALAQLLSERPIPLKFLEYHLQGFELDAAGWQPQTTEDLERYCYHVAGAVGCMMAIVMGVASDDEETLERAADLGIAFQLSNIARDVREDLVSGRCYLPSEWLGELGLSPETLFDPANEKAMSVIVGRLVASVETYESSARLGVGELPFRSRMAVLAAMRIYGAIGRRVRALGNRAWEQRVTVGKIQKLGYILPSFAEALAAGRR